MNTNINNRHIFISVVRPDTITDTGCPQTTHILGTTKYVQLSIYNKTASVLTLCADQNERYFGRVSVVRHFRVISVHGVEAGFVLQTEHKYHSVHPGGKL